MFFHLLVLRCHLEYKPSDVIPWRAFFDRSSNHGSERLFIKFLTSGCVCLIDDSVLFEQHCYTGPYLTTCAIALLTSVIDHFLVSYSNHIF